MVSGFPKGNLGTEHVFSSQVGQIGYHCTYTTHGKAKVNVRWDSILSINVFEFVHNVNWYGSCQFLVSTLYFLMNVHFHGSIPRRGVKCDIFSCG